METKFYYVYKTTNLTNGKFYVGMHSTINLEDGYLGSGLYITRSLAKYGKENFTKEILEFFDSFEQMQEAEAKLIEENMKNPLCKNMRPGGAGSWDKYWESEEYRNKKKEVQRVKFLEYHKIGKLKRVDWTGKTHTEETIEKMKESHKGKQTGELNSQFGTIWIHNEKENKKVKKEELALYLEIGWIKGRKMNLNKQL